MKSSSNFSVFSKIIITTVCVGITFIGAPLAANASVTPNFGTPKVTVSKSLGGSLSSYTKAAEALPKAESDAIERDLGITGAEFLQQGAAEAEAVKVVKNLKASGIQVVDSKINKTSLVVYVTNKSDADKVAKAGAVAKVGAPVKADLTGLTFKPAENLYNGSGYFWVNANGSGYQCSVGFNGFASASGASQMATAGHCVSAMDANSKIRVINQTAPGVTGSAGTIFGAPVANSSTFGTGKGGDSGLVNVNSAVIPVPSVTTWNGGAGNPSVTTLPVTGMSSAIVGASLCKSGSRTGWTCGTVKYVDANISVSGGTVINSIIASVCVQPGDSGGAAMIGSNAVGISSTTSNASACTSTSYAGFFPMVSDAGKTSVSSSYSGSWEPSVTVSAPVVKTVTQPTASAAGKINGTLPNPSSTSKVTLYLDGSTAPSAIVSATTGTWEIVLPNMAAGTHRYSVVATWGKWSKSVSTSGTVTVPVPPAPKPSTAPAPQVTPSPLPKTTVPPAPTPTPGATVPKTPTPTPTLSPAPSPSKVAIPQGPVNVKVSH